jgi:amino acid transporter
MSEKANEEAKSLLNEEKPVATEGSAATAESNPYVDEMCCCCICQCSTKKTEDLSCCGCFPIKCGLVTIGGFTFAVTLFLLIEIFYMLLVEDIHWWYVLVALVLCVPLIIACTFFIFFFSNDTDDSRSRLYVAQILAIITYVLVAVWNTVYFLAFFKSDTVTYGTPEAGYYKQSKKQYIFFSIFIAAILISLNMYFMCVSVTYKSALNKPEEEKAADEENKSQKSKASSKKSSKKSEKKDDEEKKDE